MNNCFSEGSINRYLKVQIIYKHGILVGEKKYRVTEFQVLPLKQNSITLVIICTVFDYHHSHKKCKDNLEGSLD